MLFVTLMPRPNQKTITVSTTFYTHLQETAKARDVSIALLLKQTFDALGQGDTYLTIAQDGTFKHKGRFFVEVSKRGFRIIKYGCEVYRKPSPYMVERFIHAPLNLIPLDDPVRDKKTSERVTHLEAQAGMLKTSCLSSEDLIKEGVRLIKSFDPERGKDIEDALKDLRSTDAKK